MSFAKSDTPSSPKVDISPCFEASIQPVVEILQAVPDVCNLLPKLVGPFGNAPSSTNGSVPPIQQPDVLGHENLLPAPRHSFPLPPPPPPPPSAPIHHHGQGLHSLQEGVRDSREALVGARFRLHTKRREVQNIRQETSSRTGAAYSLIRNYLLSQDTPTPSHVLETIQRVDELRDKLGILETNYDDAEERYNQQEWAYTLLEETLIGSLPDQAIGTHGPLRNKVKATETDFLTRFADATVDVLNYSNLDELVQISLDDRELPLGQDDHQVARSAGDEDTVNCVILRGARSQQDHFEQRIQDPLPRSFSEADIDTTRPQWPSIRYRINEWLLGSLESSTLQRQRLRGALFRHNLGDRDWFQTVMRFWYTDSSHGYSIQTGDTTISDPAGEHTALGLVSSDVLNRPFQKLPESELDNAEDPQWFPLHLSTTSTCSLHDVTVRTETHGKHTLGPQHAIIDEDAVVDAHTALPTTQGLYTSTSASNPDSDCKTTNDENPRHNVQLLNDAHICQGSAVMPAGMSTIQSVSMERIDSAFPDVIRGEGTVQIPSHLFIKVPGPRSWYLPLLRLTPVPRSVQPLDCIPFVSLSDTQSYLPGPFGF